MDDKDLLIRLKQNNAGAQQWVVETYHTEIINFCYRLIKNHEDSEEVAQEVFIAFFNSIDRFNEKSSIKTYIFSIAYNKYYNYLRKRNRKKFISTVSFNLIPDDSGKEYKIPDHTFNPEKSTIDSENRQIVQKAIDSLPAKYKTALVLYTYQQKSYDQISKIMNVSMSSVETLIYRARKKIKIFLQENHKNGY